MKALVKFGVVLAGYAAAVLAASAAVAVRVATTSGPDAQASAGMYSFGDGLLFVAVFSAVAFFPTGLAMYFLRPFRWFWVALSITALTIAVTGLLAASVYAVARCLALPRESPLMPSTMACVVSWAITSCERQVKTVPPGNSSRGSVVGALK
jgi:hypothetical protein